MKGSVQHCVKSKIDVLSKETFKVLKFAKSQVYYDRIDLEASLKYIAWIYNHVTLCNIFLRNMLSRLNTLSHGALHMFL